MQVDLIPTLIDQYRETFEGEVQPGVCWITSGPRSGALLGTLEALTADQAFAAPVPGGRPAAAHAAHLRFTLDLTLRRLHGDNPAADWPASFDLPPDHSPAAWQSLRQDDGVLQFFQQRRQVPVQDWPPIHVVGLSAMIAHNAYHLGAIRQIAQVVRGRPTPPEKKVTYGDSPVAGPRRFRRRPPLLPLHPETAHAAAGVRRPCRIRPRRTPPARRGRDTSRGAGRSR